RKLLFVLLIIAIFRLGSQVPAPGVHVANVQSCLDDVGNSGIYSLINLFSGGALLQLTIFALGIMPYLVMVIPMTAGTAVIMWLGELITDRGVGNGMSILIFTQVVATFPVALWNVKTEKGWFVFGIVVA